MDDLQRRAREYLSGVCGVGVHGVQDADVLRLSALLHEVAGETRATDLTHSALSVTKESLAAEREKRLAVEAVVVELRAALAGVLRDEVARMHPPVDPDLRAREDVAQSLRRNHAKQLLSAPNAGERLLAVAKAAQAYTEACEPPHPGDADYGEAARVRDEAAADLRTAVRAWEGR